MSPHSAPVSSHTACPCRWQHQPVWWSRRASLPLSGPWSLAPPPPRKWALFNWLEHLLPLVPAPGLLPQLKMQLSTYPQTLHQQQACPLPCAASAMLYVTTGTFPVPPGHSRFHQVSCLPTHWCFLGPETRLPSVSQSERGNSLHPGRPWPWRLMRRPLLACSL